MPKVSVIVPNYNHARFLPQRLESVLSQTFSDYELLILDDKSLDDSVAVIEGYLADPRARLELNSVNTGNPYHQWAKGLALTHGAYVWIAESDDYADPELLETLVAALERNPSAGIAMCLSTKIDGDGQSFGGYFDRWATSAFADYGAFPFVGEDFVMSGREYCARFMSPINTIPNASAVVFRRAALEAIGGPVLDMKICGDWFTYCKILMQSDIVTVPVLLNYFRHHPTNLRLRTKASDFVRESRTVTSYLERKLGHKPSSRAQRRVHDQYAQMLVGAERGSQRAKVPAARYPAVLKAAAEFGPALVGRVAWQLARETAARLIGRQTSGA